MDGPRARPPAMDPHRGPAAARDEGSRQVGPAPPVPRPPPRPGVRESCARGDRCGDGRRTSQRGRAPTRNRVGVERHEAETLTFRSPVKGLLVVFVMLIVRMCPVFPFRCLDGGAGVTPVPPRVSPTVPPSSRWTGVPVSIRGEFQVYREDPVRRECLWSPFFE